jgi:hypothetical protein
MRHAGGYMQDNAGGFSQDVQDKMLDPEGHHMKYILSYGGGVNSTALMAILVKEKYPLDEVVFADTGAERPETYRYLRFARSFLKKHRLNLRVLRSKNGNLLDTCRKRKVIPSMIWRWSTRDYKITPIYAYYRSLQAHINQYIGIASDEIDRMKDSFADYVTNIYPLVDLEMNREDCVRVIREAGLPIPTKSGCFFCPFNTIERWHDIYTKQRPLYIKAMRLEERSKHFPKQRLTPLTLRGLAVEFRRGPVPNGISSSETPCGSDCMT